MVPWFARTIGVVRTALALGVLLAMSAAQPALAEEEILGAAEFRSACTPCHGVEGRGDGPAAGSLKIRPPDLTRLAADNRGTFPTRRVLETIDGRQQVTAHGDRDMPVWGDRYRVEADSRFGPEGGEWEATARMLMLVFYLQQIQEEPPAE